MNETEKMLKLGVDYKGIRGALIGDVSGSTVEFNGYAKPKTKAKAELFPEESTFTDDTVLTAAVADNLADLSVRPISDSLRAWAKMFPHAGYGSRFTDWIYDEEMGPYNSFGNGSAMRVSAVGYFAKTEEEVIELSHYVTECTHNHPEGIKGAEVVAMIIFKAMHGATKEELHEYAEQQYDFESLDYEEMKSFMGHGDEICQITVPQALWAFFHSDSFEDCLRTCLTIGWDCDTLAAIACSMAEAYYKEIPVEIVAEAEVRTDHRVLEALEKVPTKLR